MPEKPFQGAPQPERHTRAVLIFNRMSAVYYEILKPLAEEELGIAVLGYFPENKDLQIASRHLGLCLPGELEDLQGKIRVTAAKTLEPSGSVESEKKTLF